jgi:ADP-L-glycero-D-manno-heptose 6-epimerase
VVTGGAGFIGSAICAMLEARQVGPIVVVDELQGEQWLNIAKRSLHALIAPRAIWDYLKTCPEDTVVIHMGARTSTTDDDLAALQETNVKLTVDLFDYCAERQWQFVYASSASVYGSAGDQSDDDANIRTLRPVNPYGWSKLAADKAIIEHAAHNAPPAWAGLRFFNVYGPAEEHKGGQRSFVSKCFDDIRQGKPIILFRGSETYRRDWVYVGDVAELVGAILTDRAVRVKSGIYNVGSGAAASFTDVTALCIETSGKIAPVSTVPFPDKLRGRYQSYTLADTSKLHALMPEFKFTDLKTGAGLAWKFARQDGLGRFP